VKVAQVRREQKLVLINNQKASLLVTVMAGVVLLLVDYPWVLVSVSPINQRPLLSAGISSHVARTKPAVPRNSLITANI
jgi:hypothetical protein